MKASSESGLWALTISLGVTEVIRGATIQFTLPGAQTPMHANAGMQILDGPYTISAARPAHSKSPAVLGGETEPAAALRRPARSRLFFQHPARGCRITVGPLPVRRASGVPF